MTTKTHRDDAHAGRVDDEMASGLAHIGKALDSQLLRQRFAHYSRNTQRRSTRDRLYQRAMQFSDAVAATVGALLAYALHPDVNGGANVQILPLRLAVALMPPFWTVAMWVERAYDRRRVGEDPKLDRKVIGASGLLIACSAISALLVDSMSLLWQMICAIPLAAVLTPIVRAAVKAWLIRIRLGLNERRVLLVGRTRSVERFSAQARPGKAPLRVVGACLIKAPDAESTDDLPIADDGHVEPGADPSEMIVQTASAMDCDAVIVLACPELEGPALRDLSWKLSDIDVDLAVMPMLIDVAARRIHIETVDGMQLFRIGSPDSSGALKRFAELLERSFAALLLVLFAPLMLGVAILVRATSPGPALFKQTRVGLNGVEFTCIKFRTMVADAERMREHLEHLNEKSDGVLFKIRRDSRITPIGRILRKRSLDELPQLINVLRGEMSLVGPRPPLPSEAARYTDEVRQRLTVKPGITGLWQVSGRSLLTWDESVRLDLSYVENWSPQLEAKIIMRTPGAVVRGTGAF